jgi:hypothetical protein
MAHCTALEGLGVHEDGGAMHDLGDVHRVGAPSLSCACRWCHDVDMMYAGKMVGFR